MVSEPSDWDPLPESGAAQHPGEAAAFGLNPPRQSGGRNEAAAGASAVPTLAGTAAAVTAAPPGDLAPAGDGTLHVVAGMLPQRPLRPSALAAVMQRPDAAAQSGQLTEGRRSEAPRAAVKAPLRAVASPAHKAARPAGNASVMGPALADARENEPWFRALPAVEQQRLQHAWSSELAAATPVLATQHKQQELLEWFWVAYVVFFLAALPLMLLEGLSGFVRMAMAGCVTGMVWQMVPRTRFACVASAVTVYFAIVLIPRLSELWSSPFDLLVALGGAGIVGYLSSLALHEELHRRPAAAPDAPVD